MRCLFQLAIMLSTTSGWVLPSEDKAYDLPLSPHDSSITGEVDGRRARRQLASVCSGSWSASAPAQPFFPVYPRVRTRDLARSDSSPSPPPLSPPPPSTPPSPPRSPPSPPPLRPPPPVPLPHPKASHADESGGDCWLAWEANDLPKDAKELTLKHGALRAEEMAVVALLEAFELTEPVRTDVSRPSTDPIHPDTLTKP